MAKPINIAGESFGTQAKAKKFVTELRDRHEDGILIDEPDNSFLVELLNLHPEAIEKIGPGISHFTVAPHPVFRRSRHFLVHRVDGSFTDFSFHSCIDGENPRRDRLGALRRAIEYSILRYRDDTFNRGAVFCPFLRIKLSPQSSHVDHVQPDTFKALTERWMLAESISLEQISITPPTDNQTVALMTDERQRLSWIEYHDRHANLQIISPLGNLSHAKRTP